MLCEDEKHHHHITLSLSSSSVWLHACQAAVSTSPREDRAHTHNIIHLSLSFVEEQRASRHVSSLPNSQSTPTLHPPLLSHIHPQPAHPPSPMPDVVASPIQPLPSHRRARAHAPQPRNPTRGYSSHHCSSLLPAAQPTVPWPAARKKKPPPAASSPSSPPPPWRRWRPWRSR